MDFLGKIVKDGKDFVESKRSVSKGVQVYWYSSVPGFRVEFNVPGYSIAKDQVRSWSSDHLEVESNKIEGFGSFTGKFSFRVLNEAGEELTNQWVDVDSLTGDLKDGSMKDLQQMRTVSHNDILVNYGLYDAGPGVAGLPSSHQCYVTVSKARNNWMGDVVPRDSPTADHRLSRFVLPAPHDPGMNAMDTVNEILSKNAAAGAFLGALKNFSFANSLIEGGLSLGYAGDVVYALSITQKDSVSDMLRLGARYFEFRPGKLPRNVIELSNIEDKYYFLHAVIPGLAYNVFLETIIGFLSANPDEIVVVHLRRDGVLAPPSIPFDDGEVDRLANETCEKKGSAVLIGNEDEMRNQSIRQLRDAKKRLIIVKNASQYSTYDDIAYATLNGDSIVGRFDTLQKSEQSKYLLTLLQCQATASNIRDVVVHSVMASNSSTSCLMATKTFCDIKTHPWIMEFGFDRLEKDQLLVIMNDWIDGATCDIAIELSQKRLAAD